MRAMSAGDTRLRVSLGDSPHYARFCLRNDIEFERKQKSQEQRNDGIPDRRLYYPFHRAIRPFLRDAPLHDTMRPLSP